MTLIIDERARLQGQPGFHAFIAGVSSYPHLPGGTGTPAPNNFGMQQLSSAALTAYKLYCWLVERQRKLPVPLATCRLLLSPSPEEVRVEPRLNGLADPCTLNAFQTAAGDWRTDASSHQENVTFFYFAGHGVQRSKGDQVLLLEDFGDGRGGTLNNAVNTKNIYNGMVKSPARPTMAQTQLYFIDACRILPSLFKDFEPMETSAVWDIDLGGRDDRRAPIFYAAVPGSVAYAVRGDQTIFSKALFACLNGGAAKPEEQDGELRWQVSILSLMETLGVYVDELNQTQGADQEFTVDGWAHDAVIHYLDGPPLVESILEVVPADALAFVEIEVWDNYTNERVWNLPPPLNPYPYHGVLPAGEYRMSVHINPPQPMYRAYTQLSLVKPRSFRWKARVSP
jgi:hypothetical protein